VNEVNDRRASGWRRLTEGLRRVLVRLRPSTNAAGAVQEYIRVIPVLAGQVRQASSQIEDSRQTLQQLLDHSAKHARLSTEAVARYGPHRSRPPHPRVQRQGRIGAWRR
jgi:hypothetical protein